MVKIRVNYKWCWLQYIFLSVCCVFMLLLPVICNWYEDAELWIVISWNIVFPGAIIVFIPSILYNYQIAIINEENISIKSIFGLIKVIYWKDVYDVRIVEMVTGTAGVKTINKEWIVIQTDKDQCDPYIKPNRKKKGPWYIAATRKNIDVIKEYMDKCRSDILPIEP